MGSRFRPPLDGQLELFSAPAKRKQKHRVPRGSSYPPGYFDHTIAVLDAIEAQRKGLKPFEGRCIGCGKVISSKARTCGRRTCSAVYPTWKRDQRAVVREALNEYGGLLLLTDVTLPGGVERVFRGMFGAMDGMEQFARPTRYPRVTVFPIAIYRRVPVVVPT